MACTEASATTRSAQRPYIENNKPALGYQPETCNNTAPTVDSHSGQPQMESNDQQAHHTTTHQQQHQTTQVRCSSQTSLRPSTSGSMTHPHAPPPCSCWIWHVVVQLLSSAMAQAYPSQAVDGVCPFAKSDGCEAHGSQTRCFL